MRILERNPAAEKIDSIVREHLNSKQHLNPERRLTWALLVGLAGRAYVCDAQRVSAT